MSDTPPRRKVTYKTLLKKMEKGEPITQLAAYDYRTAVVADRLGMDILCVSDTGGMILFGHQSTVSVSFDEVMVCAWSICLIGASMFQKSRLSRMLVASCMRQTPKL